MVSLEASHSSDKARAEVIRGDMKQQDHLPARPVDPVVPVPPA